MKNKSLDRIGGPALYVPFVLSGRKGGAPAIGIQMPSACYYEVERVVGAAEYEVVHYAKTATTEVLLRVGTTDAQRALAFINFLRAANRGLDGIELGAAPLSDVSLAKAWNRRQDVVIEAGFRQRNAQWNIRFAWHPDAWERVFRASEEGRLAGECARQFESVLAACKCRAHPDGASPFVCIPGGAFPQVTALIDAAAGCSVGGASLPDAWHGSARGGGLLRLQAALYALFMLSSLGEEQ